MPPAMPLPAGTRTLALKTDSWGPDITDLALTPDAVWTASGLFRIDPTTATVTGPFTEIGSGREPLTTVEPAERDSRAEGAA